MNRRERREQARKDKTAFQPQYNGRVITKAEYDKEVKELKELKNKNATVKSSKDTEGTVE